MAAQKTLIQQLQESEAEARELQDFLQVSSIIAHVAYPPPLKKYLCLKSLMIFYFNQAEKSTLVDALRDSDGEVRRLKNEIANKEHHSTFSYVLVKWRAVTAFKDQSADKLSAKEFNVAPSLITFLDGFL